MYLHGTYAEKLAYDGLSVAEINGTVPVYIGTAPINQLNTNNESDFDYSDYINKPMLISSFSGGKSVLGQSTDFSTFSLMEAIYAHFNNGSYAVGPIIVINMLDPSKTADDEIETTIALSTVGTNKVGYIDDPLAIIESVTSDDLTSSDTLTYESGQIKITLASSSLTELEVAYDQMDATTVATIDFQSAVDALDLCEISTGIIPNILLAPAYSSVKAYHDILIEKATAKISGKWNFVVYTDIPALDVTSVADAIDYKTDNYFNSKYEKLFYPKANLNGNIYHLSTLAAVVTQYTDTNNDDIPSISPSNKGILATSSVLDDGSAIYITENNANLLNAEGITTTNILRSELRLWGPHNANYSYANESNIDLDELQDASIRMMMYIQNYLQYEFIDNIDSTFSKRDSDSLTASVKQWLNSMVSSGDLLYGDVSFDASDTAGIVVGDFTFNLGLTTAPNAKSITFKVSYTEDGLSSYYDTEVS